MYWVTQVLLALATLIVVAENVEDQGGNSDNAATKPLNPLATILNGLNKGSQGSQNPQSGESGPGVSLSGSEKPQSLPEIPNRNNTGKPRLTIGDLLTALLLERSKNGSANSPVNPSKVEDSKDKTPNKESNNGDKNETGNNSNLTGVDGKDKTNNSVIILNIGGLQDNGLSFLNDLDPKQGFIYAIQPGGQPQLLPLNQLNLISHSNLPKYVVLLCNDNSFVGNSGLQFLDGLLANGNGIRLPNQDNIGVVQNNLPSGIIPLLNMLPNLGVQGVNIVPNIWSNGKFSNQPTAQNPGVPIINVFPNIGSNQVLTHGKPVTPDLLPPSSNNEVKDNFNIPDFLKPWINNISEKPIKDNSNQGANIPTNVPDGGLNWLNILQMLGSINNPGQGTTNSNVDLNNLLTILVNKGPNILQPNKPENPGSEGVKPNIIITNNGAGVSLQPNSENKSDNDQLTSSLLLTLINLLTRYNKDNVKYPVEDKPVKNPEVPKISDSTLVNILLNLMGKKPSSVTKPNADDSKTNITELSKILVSLLGRKPNVVVIGNKNEQKEEKDNGYNVELKLPEIIIELLGRNPNIILNGLKQNKGPGTNMGKVEVDRPKITDTELSNILFQILSEQPNKVIKGPEENIAVSGRGSYGQSGTLEGKLPNIILQLFGVQPSIVPKGDIINPKINVGSQLETAVPNWPVSVPNEGFMPGRVGIDPQFLALLMKTFSEVNLPNNYGTPTVGGTVSFNMPGGFGSQSGLIRNNAAWNYLLSHLGCELEDQDSVGINLMPTSKIVTTNVGTGKGLVPLNKWLQYAQMSSNNGPAFYNLK